MGRPVLSPPQHTSRPSAAFRNRRARIPRSTNAPCRSACDTLLTTATRRDHVDEDATSCVARIARAHLSPSDAQVGCDAQLLRRTPPPSTYRRMVCATQSRPAARSARRGVKITAMRRVALASQPRRTCPPIRTSDRVSTIVGGRGSGLCSWRTLSAWCGWSRPDPAIKGSAWLLTMILL